MTIKVSKPAINIREELADLKQDTGLKGQELMRAETAQEARTAIGAGRKNFIINGKAQISQRGDYTSATSATDSTFYLDRWYAQVSGSGVTATIQDTTLSQKLVATGSGSGNLEVLQKVEDFNLLTNKTITVSAKITSNSSSARIAVLTASGTWHSSSAHTGGGSEETLSVTFSSGSATRMDVWIGLTGSSRAAVSISSGDYIELTDVQLEVGKIATEFEHRSYGEELALCQRYYYLLVEGDNKEVCYGFYYNATSIYMDVSFPVTMRDAPSLEYTTGSNYYEIYANGVGDSFNTLSIQGAHPNGVSMYSTNDVSGTAGHAGFIYTANANSRIAFKAEF